MSIGLRRRPQLAALPVRVASARHEAAHAVVAWWLRAPLGTLVLDPVYGGYVNFRNSRSAVGIDRDCYPYLVRQICVKLAGIVEGSTPDGCGDDFNKVMRVAAGICPSHQVAIVAAAADIVHDVIHRAAPGIAAIAAAVLSEPTGQLRACAIRARLREFRRPAWGDVEDKLRQPLTTCVNAGCLPPVDRDGRRVFDSHEASQRA